MIEEEPPEVTEDSQQEDANQSSAEPVSVFLLAAQTMYMFEELAYQRMGLHTDRFAGRIVKDLEQAKAAVDIADFLAEIILPQVDEPDKREVRNRIASLRINYARQAGSSTDSPSD